MKKYLAIMLAVITAAIALSGCGAKESAEDSVKTGFAVINSIAKSKSAETGAGLAEINSIAAAVTVDKDGKITKCIIDSVQTKVDFSNEGKITTSLEKVFNTKSELKEEYDMKGASGIGKEWYQQAKAFADYVQGKTSSEVGGIKMDEKGHPTDSDLTSSVTVAVGDFIECVKNAVDDAKDAGAKKGDKLGLGISTNIANSKDATDDENGTAQAYSTYTVVTTDSNGKITSCTIDASQSEVNFDKTGTVTSDISAAPKTKNELGDDYNMKRASGIGKEWYEQAASFAKYAVGKTASQIQGIAVDENNHPTGQDLTATVTISIGDFKDAVQKAASNAG